MRLDYQGGALHQTTLMIKFAVTGFLALLLIVLLLAISGLVTERHSSSLQVLEDIQRLSVRDQTVVGPILVVPYRKTVLTKTTDSHGVSSVQSNTIEGQLYFLPSVLTIDGKVTTEMRHRGIYSALLYSAQQTLNGSFVVPEHFGVESEPKVTYTYSPARLILGISDTRGVKGTPGIHWGNISAEWKGGTEAEGMRNGLHAELGPVEPGRSYDYAIDLDLQGTHALAYVP